ncbi:MAG: hypothetical protein WC284_12580, partial [Candidimonas sp.]
MKIKEIENTKPAYGRMYAVVPCNDVDDALYRGLTPKEDILNINRGNPCILLFKNDASADRIIDELLYDAYGKQRLCLLEVRASNITKYSDWISFTTMKI